MAHVLTTPSAIFKAFERLTSRTVLASDPDLIAGVAEVSVELEGMVNGNGHASVEDVRGVMGSLRQIEGMDGYERRVDSLVHAGQYLYLAGDTFSAFEGVEEAVALADQGGDRNLQRKAVNLLGILFADTGIFPRAFECYERAIRLARELKLTNWEATERRVRVLSGFDATAAIGTAAHAFRTTSRTAPG